MLQTEGIIMKNLPFNVPEGYFDGLEKRLVRHEPLSGPSRHGNPRLMAAVFSCAAAVAAVVLNLTLTIGSRKSSEASVAGDLYVELMISDLIPVSEPESLFAPYGEDDGADSDYAALSEEDVVNYMIETGVSLEDAYLILGTEVE